MSYWAVAAALVLVGGGVGISFVSLTDASLAEVEPADAGAASGLVDVTQQLGAAVGLACRTVFGSATDGTPVGEEFVHGLHAVYWVGALFTLAALSMVITFVRRPDATPSLELLEDGEVSGEPAWLAEATADVA